MNIHETNPVNWLYIRQNTFFYICDLFRYLAHHCAVAFSTCNLDRLPKDMGAIYMYIYDVTCAR